MQRYSLKTMAKQQKIRRRVNLRPPAMRIALEHDLIVIARKVVLEPFRQMRAQLLAEALADRPEMVTDGFTDFLRQFSRVYSQLTVYARQMAQRTLDLEAVRHTDKWLAQVNKAIGVDVAAVVRSADIKPHVDLATDGYVAQIKGLGDDIQKRLSGRLIPMISAGASRKEMAAVLTKEFGFAKKRAEFIARDQAAKFNGNLNKVRQQQAGVTQYEWSTSLDERVRPSHAAREGKTFDWNRPPEGGHPGEDFNCRCVAIAILD